MTAEELAAAMDPDAFNEEIVPANLGQSWDRMQRQEAALAHARVALGVLVSEGDARCR